MNEDSERQAGRTDGEPEHKDRPESLGQDPELSLGQTLGIGAAAPQVEQPVALSADVLGDDDIGGAGAGGRTGGRTGGGTGGAGGGPGGTGDRRRRGLRVRTVVFGLVLLAISLSVLVTLLTDVRVDATGVTFVVLIGAGAALVAGGLAAAVREARGGPGL